MCIVIYCCAFTGGRVTDAGNAASPQVSKRGDSAGFTLNRHIYIMHIICAMKKRSV
jgi:hypothetical protein